MTRAKAGGSGAAALRLPVGVLAGEDSLGFAGGEGGVGEVGEAVGVAVEFVGFFEHAVVDGGFEVDEVAFGGVGERQDGEHLARAGVGPGGERDDLDGDVRPLRRLDQVGELRSADGGVGQAGDGVLVDDRVQLARVSVAGEDVLAAQPGLDVPGGGGAGDPGGGGDRLDVGRGPGAGRG